VVLRGQSEELAVWRAELDKLYEPRRLVLAVPADASGLPAALADKRPQQGTVAYVCRGTTCSPPHGTLGDLVRALKSGAT